MDKNDIILLLELYKENKAIIELYAMNYGKLKNDIITAESLQATTIKDMPTSFTNKFSSTVENIVCNIDSQISDAQKEINKLVKDIKTVEILIDTLGAKHKFLLESIYIDELTWNEIGLEYKKRYGFNITKRGMQKFKDIVLNKMCKVFDRFMSLS